MAPEIESCEGSLSGNHSLRRQGAFLRQLMESHFLNCPSALDKIRLGLRLKKGVDDEIPIGEGIRLVGVSSHRLCSFDAHHCVRASPV